MTGKVYNDISTNDIFVESDSGETIWSTQTRPLNLLPDENAIVYTGGVDFPELQKGWIYSHYRSSNDPFNGTSSCSSYASLLNGEYGPNETGLWNLPDIVLGVAPAGVNYIDVRATLTRTINPDPIMGTALPSMLTAGKETFLPGGSCIIESTPRFKKMFSVVLEGSNIILRRRVSVWDASSEFPSPPGSVFGWRSDNARSPFYSHIQTKTGAYVDNRRAYGEWDACSTDLTGVSTRSFYSGSIKIRLGYIECQGGGCSVNGGTVVTVDRDPVDGWRFNNTPGQPYYYWETRSFSGGPRYVLDITWNNQNLLSANLPEGTTSYISPDGWEYIRGPLQQNFGDIQRHGLARIRTILSR